MDKEKKKPAIRFKGFTEDWKHCMVGSIINFLDDKTLIEDEYPVLSSTMSGIYLQKDYFNQEVTTASNCGYKKVPYGFITYRAMSDTNEFYFNIQRLIKIGIVSPAYPVFSVKDNNIADFLTYYMNHNSNFKNQIVQSTEGGTRYALSGKKLARLFVKIATADEQEKITKLLLELDNLITSKQREYEKLVIMKKAMLKKMFPQEGSKTPEIRFEEFTDDWELRKLGELGTVQTCKRIFKEQTSENGEIPFYKNGTLGLETDSYISREIYEEFKRLYPFPEVGDILISVVGSIGRTAEYMGKDEYFQDSNVVWLKTDGRINKKFLKISYQVINWLIEGSTIKHLYNDNILRSEIMCPKSQIEQQKIGDYFQNFDNRITLHQRKLDKLKIIKAGCLEKMFV